MAPPTPRTKHAREHACLPALSHLGSVLGGRHFPCLPTHHENEASQKALNKEQRVRRKLAVLRRLAVEDYDPQIAAVVQSRGKTDPWSVNLRLEGSGDQALNLEAKTAARLWEPAVVLIANLRGHHQQLPQQQQQQQQKEKEPKQAVAATGNDREAQQALDSNEAQEDDCSPSLRDFLLHRPPSESHSYEAARVEGDIRRAQRVYDQVLIGPVLELGSGLGFVGLHLASLGVEVLLSDLPIAQPLLERSISANKAVVSNAGGSAKTCVLDWGRAEQDWKNVEKMISHESGVFQAAVASDPVFDDITAELFCCCVKFLLSTKKVPFVLLSHKHRPHVCCAGCGDSPKVRDELEGLELFTDFSSYSEQHEREALAKCRFAQRLVSHGLRLELIPKLALESSTAGSRLTHHPFIPIFCVTAR